MATSSRTKTVTSPGELVLIDRSNMSYTGITKGFMPKYRFLKRWPAVGRPGFKQFLPNFLDMDCERGYYIKLSHNHQR